MNGTYLYDAVIAAFKHEEAHAALSPSASSRWLRCTGSVEHNAGRDDPNEYADEGTAAHTLSAFALVEDRMCADYMGQVIPVLNNDGSVRREYTVDDEMATYAQVYVDGVRDKIHAGTQVFIEKRVQTGIASNKWGEIGGTGDAILLDLSYGIIDVNDLKYGKGIQVDACKPIPSPEFAAGPCVKHDGIYWELNPQLALYGYGALTEYGWMSRFEKVRLCIHQPRLDHYSVAEISAADLLAWGQGHVRSIVEEIDTAPTYRPEEDTCRWCAVKANCRALNEYVERTVKDDFSDVTAMTDNTAIAAALERLSLVEQWVKAVSTKSRELAEHGMLPGWKMVHVRKGNRTWKDKAATERLFKDTYRLKDDVAYKPRQLISPTDAKKLFKTSPRRWDDVQEHIVRGNPVTSLVRESDPRPAVTTADDFGVVK